MYLKVVYAVVVNSFDVNNALVLGDINVVTTTNTSDNRSFQRWEVFSVNIVSAIPMSLTADHNTIYIIVFIVLDIGHQIIPIH